MFVINKKNNNCYEEFSFLIQELTMPLNVINSTAQIVKKSKQYGNLTDEKLFEYMDCIKSYCNKLTLLTNNISDSNLLSQENIMSNYEILNIETYIVTLTQNVKKYLDKLNITFETVINLKGKTMNCNFLALERLLLNIISSALNYNNEKVQILTFEVWDEQDIIYFSIKDDRKNIAEEIIENLHVNNNKTAHLCLKNAKLALSSIVIKKYLDFLKGNVKFTSEANNGVSISISLPRNPKTTSRFLEPTNHYEPNYTNIEIELSNLK